MYERAKLVRKVRWCISVLHVGIWVEPDEYEFIRKSPHELVVSFIFMFVIYMCIFVCLNC